MDDSYREPSDDDPQGGYDVQCWRTPDGVGHRFDDNTYDSLTGCGVDSSEWKAWCGASLEHGVPDLKDPIDCMTCLVREADRAAA